MSWNSQIIDIFHDTVEADLEKAAIIGQDINEPHVAEAVNAAKQAVIKLARSGAIGWGDAKVTLSGHANPDHKPVEGWANDFIAVNIWQD